MKSPQKITTLLCCAFILDALLACVLGLAVGSILLFVVAVLSQIAP